MKSLKGYLGLIPATLINRILKRGISRDAMRSLINFVNSHPNWLGGVDRKIRTTTNFNFRIYCDRKETIGQSILFNGQWERLLSQTIVACLKPGEFSIDIGANIGYDTLLMSNAVGPTGLVLAFEPDFYNLAQLLRNVEEHQFKNIVVESIALSNDNSLTKIARAVGDNRGVSNLREDGVGESQPILTSRLDRIIDNSISRRINFIKMDIEGFEYNALQGIGELIENVEHLTCEINHEFLKQCGSSAKMIFDHMHAHGSASYCAEPSSVGRWVKHDHTYVPTTVGTGHFDVLFCRRVNDALCPLISVN